MKKKYALYCSGKAGRVLKFYNIYKFQDYPLQFVFYDGSDEDTLVNLNNLVPVPVLTYDSNLPISRQLLELSVLHDVDYIFCFGSRILKGELLIKYKNRIVNFHPSLLPAFPGLNSIDQALKSTVQILGNTAHFIDSGIDTGPIIMQSVISKSSYVDYESVLGLQIHMLKKIWYLLDTDGISIDDENIITTGEINHNREIFYSLI